MLDSEKLTLKNYYQDLNNRQVLYSGHEDIRHPDYELNSTHKGPVSGHENNVF